MVIQNTMFKKDREKKITYKSGGAETQVDYIMLRRHREMKVKDCKVIPGEAFIPQHRVLVADVVVTSSCEGGFRRKGRKKLKTWKLQENERRREYGQLLAEKLEAAGGEWKDLEACMMEAGKEVCGETTGRRQKDRETWWWTECRQPSKRRRKISRYGRELKMKETNKCTRN